MLEWEVVLASTERRTDPWGNVRTLLKTGQLVRFPDKRVWVVGYVNSTRARVHPLTPTTRTITVPSKLNKKVKETKEVNETGDPTDISPASILPRVGIEDLTEGEFERLERYVETGGEVDGV